MPPAPSGERTSYGPSRVPGVMLTISAKDILPRNGGATGDLVSRLDSVRDSLRAFAELRRFRRPRPLRTKPRSDPAARQDGLSLLLPRLPAACQDGRRRDHA